MARKTNKRPLRQSLLIVVEGDTESFYFSQLRSECSTHSVQIIVKQKDSENTPKRMVDYAERLNYQREFDKIWCVFDQDTKKKAPGSYEEAIQKAKSHKFDIANSSPCFELWFLLHFTFTTRNFENCKQAEDTLREHLSDYCKKQEYLKNLFKRLLPQLPKALKNCAKLRKYN